MSFIYFQIDIALSRKTPLGPPLPAIYIQCKMQEFQKKKTDDPSFVYNKMSTIRRVGYNQPSQTYHV